MSPYSLVLTTISLELHLVYARSSIGREGVDALSFGEHEFSNLLDKGRFILVISWVAQLWLLVGHHADILTLIPNDGLRLSFIALKYPLNLLRGLGPAIQFDSIELELIEWHLNPRENIDSILIRKITAR